MLVELRVDSCLRESFLEGKERSKIVGRVGWLVDVGWQIDLNYQRYRTGINTVNSIVGLCQECWEVFETGMDIGMVNHGKL